MKKTEKKPLPESARIARVLGSQSKSPFLADALPAASLKKLAACCDDRGEIAESAPVVVHDVLAEYYDSQKATVDDTPKPTPAPTPTEK